MFINHQSHVAAFTWEHFTGNDEDIYPWYKFENYWFKITPTYPRDQWVNDKEPPPTMHGVGTEVVESDSASLAAYHLWGWVHAVALPCWWMDEGPWCAWWALQWRLPSCLSPGVLWFHPLLLTVLVVVEVVIHRLHMYKGRDTNHNICTITIYVPSILGEEHPYNDPYQLLVYPQPS